MTNYEKHKDKIKSALTANIINGCKFCLVGKEYCDARPPESCKQTVDAWLDEEVQE